MRINVIHSRLDLIEDATAILRSCCPGDNGKYAAWLVERCLLVIRRELADANPTDPGDPIRQAIQEKCEAGETR